MAGRIITLTLLLLASPGAWAGPRVGGYTKAYTFVGLRDPYALDRTGARLQLEVEAAQGPAAMFAAVDFDVDGRAVVSGDGERGSELHVYPVEAFVTLSAGPMDLKLGRQFIFWGGSSWKPPADVLCPWDPPNMSDQIEDYRVARTGARALVYLGDLTLDLVWLPIFEGDRGMADAGPDQVAGLRVDKVEVRPDPTLDQSEVGLRLSHTMWGLDWALTLFHGRDHTPEFHMEPVTPSRGAPIPTAWRFVRSYPERYLVGLDLTKTWDPFLVRIEGAYSHRPDGSSEDMRRVSSFDTVSTLSWSLGASLTLELEARYSRLVGYDRDAWAAAAAQAHTGGAPDEGSLQVGGSARFSIGQSLTGQVLTLVDTTYLDTFTLGYLSYEVASGVKVYGGAVVFTGDDDQSYGRLVDYGQAFGEVKFSF